jgi:antitoxin CptB
MIEKQELSRMRWAARRGMLELDLVLEPFVNSRYETLSAADRCRFQRLMQCEDQDLYDWLLQREQPPEEEFARIVERILQFTHTPPDAR